MSNRIKHAVVKSANLVFVRPIDMLSRETSVLGEIGYTGVARNGDNREILTESSWGRMEYLSFQKMAIRTAKHAFALVLPDKAILYGRTAFLDGNEVSMIKRAGMTGFGALVGLGLDVVEIVPQGLAIFATPVSWFWENIEMKENKAPDWYVESENMYLETE